MKLFIISLLASTGVFGDTADNKVWHSPLVFSGTCTDLDPNKKCSKISIWYVYKGEELLTEKTKKTVEVDGFQQGIIWNLDATDSKVKKDQTRVFFGQVDEKNQVQLMEKEENVYLKKLDRIARVSAFQKSNPEAQIEDLIAADFDVKHTVPTKLVTTRPTTRATTKAATTTTTSTTTTTTEEYIATTEEAVVEPEIDFEEDFEESFEAYEPEDSSSIDSRDDYDEETWGESDTSDTSYPIDNNSDVNAGEAPGSEYEVDSERSDYGDEEVGDEYSVEKIEEEYVIPENDYAERTNYDTEVPDLVTIKPENSYADPVTEKIIDREIDADYVRTTINYPDVIEPSIDPFIQSGINGGAAGGGDEDEGSADGLYFESDDEEENEYLIYYDSEELKRSRRHKYKRSVSENELWDNEFENEMEAMYIS